MMTLGAFEFLNEYSLFLLLRMWYNTPTKSDLIQLETAEAIQERIDELTNCQFLNRNLE